ncbi:hypothetical protein ACI77O_11925 [Pseudomonas tritici]|uniref:hypothetical protein n=1 Tax=Pseudomonas tritici TaxID=2745518 RepID=UPI00387A972E
MAQQFHVTQLSAQFLYGAMAKAILGALARRYEVERHIVVKHWVAWVFNDCCFVPVPTQIDSAAIPPARACQLFKQALEEVAQVEMQRMTETDRFTFSNAISQLDELYSLGIA